MESNGSLKGELRRQQGESRARKPSTDGRGRWFRGPAAVPLTLHHAPCPLGSTLQFAWGRTPRSAETSQDGFGKFRVCVISNQHTFPASARKAGSPLIAETQSLGKADAAAPPVSRGQTKQAPARDSSRDSGGGAPEKRAHGGQGLLPPLEQRLVRTAATQVTLHSEAKGKPVVFCAFLFLGTWGRKKLEEKSGYKTI